MENLIEELTKVNPSNLSEEGLKLFNKINEIIDRNEELEGKLRQYESLIKEKIEELKNTKGDFATYIAVSERIAVLEELLTPLKNV